MRTKTNVSVKRIDGPGAVIELRLALPEGDPKAMKIYTALGVFLKTILTAAEAKEFMRQIEVAKHKTLTPETREPATS